MMWADTQTPGNSDPYSDRAGKKKWRKETAGHRNRPQHLSSALSSVMEETVITSIRATGVGVDHRCPPASFYAVVHHSGGEWRTENKRSSVNGDAIEWCQSIPIPSDSWASVCLEVYASFEFESMLGVGKRLQKLMTTVDRLMNKSAKGIPFTFISQDSEVVPSCTSILITVQRQNRSIITESLDILEDTTDQKHSTSSRHRKHGKKRRGPRRAADRDPLAASQPLLHGLGLVPAANQSSVGQHLTSHHTDEERDILSVGLLARFQRFGNLDNLQRAIAILEELVRSTPVGDDQHSARLAWLGLALTFRFNRLGEPTDLENAVSVLGRAVDLTSDGHSDKPSRITDLGNSFRHRFERFGRLSDIEDAISRHKDALVLAPRGDPNKSIYLNNLGTSFLARFRRLGEPSDLEDAMSMFTDAVLISDGLGEPIYLTNLGNAYRTRFECLGELGDLENAISRHQDAVHLTPRDHPDKCVCLNNLANAIRNRFECIGGLGDLDDGISRHLDAVVLTPHNHPSKPTYLNNLGNAFRARFERLGELGDLDYAISRQKDVIYLIPDDHPQKFALLNNLGASFQSRFDRFGELSDLDNAISTLRDAVNRIPHDHISRHCLLNNLGTSLGSRFDRLGELGDLDDAISTLRNAVDLSPHGHLDRLGCLTNLSNSFRSRFECLGELSDLEEAISMLRDAVHLAPHGHPHKSAYLDSLGNCIEARFELLGEQNDLEDAISTLKHAVELTPNDHSDRHRRFLTSLGSAFFTRFSCIGDPVDLEDAISKFRDANDLTPHDHPEKPARLSNLGAALRTRFEHFGKPSDLQAAISGQRDAVYLVPHGHPNKPAFLHNLGMSFQARFKYLGELSDLDDTISRQKDVIDLTPQGHSMRPGLLTNLGTSFESRFEHLRELRDLEQAISLYSEAASALTGPIRFRFHASQKWISCARHIRHHSLLHAYSVAIGLVPQLAWVGLPLKQRYSELTRGASVVREGAAAALDLGLPEIAVEWLEQGRSIVWGEMFQLRNSYEHLSSAHPDHARRLRELSAELEHASNTREKSLSLPPEQTQNGAHRATESLQVAADRQRALAIQRDKLLQEIRGLPGFERFLLHKEFSHIRGSVRSGPVVILNAAESRCDALIVLPDLDHVIHVPLPDFTFKRSTTLQDTLKTFLRQAREGKPVIRDDFSWESLLSNLWKCVVKPVLDALALSIPGDLLRIFWCPTGPFAFLPIHAAGIYDSQHLQPGHKVFDYVISSYAPTLSILSLSPSPSEVPTDDLRLLAVRQPPSDGLSRLPGVHTELNYIKEVIRNSPFAHTSLLESSKGTVEEVLALMKEADWVHFACHGIQDLTQSGLCLADGRRLKLSDIIALLRPRGGFAFLSACQTATGDRRLSDEAVHITAGMLFAGYGSVVGTMWSISDKLAPVVARNVYEHLFREHERPDYREAARALHEAVGRLRDGNASFVEWVPFIHVGL